MPFPVLDACIALHAAEKLDAAELAAVLCDMFPEYPHDRLRGFANKFVTLFSRAIYKWVQAPLSLHLGNLDARITKWAEAFNPFFAGPNADWLALIPFAALTGFLYLTGRQALPTPPPLRQDEPGSKP